MVMVCATTYLTQSYKFQEMEFFSWLKILSTEKKSIHDAELIDYFLVTNNNKDRTEKLTQNFKYVYLKGAFFFQNNYSVDLTITVSNRF